MYSKTGQWKANTHTHAYTHTHTHTHTHARMYAHAHACTHTHTHTHTHLQSTEGIEFSTPSAEICLDTSRCHKTSVVLVNYNFN